MELLNKPLILSIIFKKYEYENIIYNISLSQNNL